MSLEKTASWSTPEAHRIARISYRMLDYWIREGLVEPAVPAKGTGNRRRFSWRDLVAVRAIAALREAGVSLQAVRKVQAALVEFEGDDEALRAGRLIIEQGRKKPEVGVAISDDEILRLLNEPGQSAMRTVFDIAPVYADVAHGVAELAKESRAEKPVQEGRAA